LKLNPATLTVSTALFLSDMVFTQDTNFEPERQQIPVPDCPGSKDVGEAGSKPRTEENHDAWLADIPHWRGEHPVRLGRGRAAAG
jgi:gamma-glutamyl hercynylcysteine S-oxide synthase